MECQPINRAIKENLSYSQTQAIYDKAYCSANMSDFTNNLIRAKTEVENLMQTIPGVSVMGIKGNPEPMYQRYFPFALLVQAFVSYTPVLLWLLWAAEELSLGVKYVALSCKELIEKNRRIAQPLFRGPLSLNTENNEPDDRHHKWSEMECQIDQWLDQKFLARLYITKLVITNSILISFLLFYFISDTLNIKTFKSHFICRVESQSLVTCTLPIVQLYKIVWYTNIFLLDCSILFTTFQFLNILCCMLRPRNFFFLSYMNIGGDSHINAITDAHVISYFCYKNLRRMPPDILICKATRSKMSKNASSTLISFGETGSESSDGDVPYYSATNTPPAGFVKQQ